MAERILPARTYVQVYFLLLCITCLSVGCSFLQLIHVWHVVIGVCLGVIKTTFVLLFFMHVLHSPRLTTIVILVACFWLGILLVLTCTDYFSRGMVPFLAGH